MITTAVVKKGGLYVPDLSEKIKLKTGTVLVDITILRNPVIKPKKKKRFNPSDFKGLISTMNLDKEIKRIRNEWDRL